MGHLAAVLVALALGAEAGPVNIWTGADPSGACKGTRIVQTTTGKTFACVAATWADRTNTGKPYDLLFTFPGLMTNDQTLTRVVAARAFTIPQNCTGSLLKMGTNAFAPVTLTMNKNGAPVGTIAVAIDGTAVFTCASAISLAIGDILTLVGPGTADNTLADVALTLVGVM